MTPSRLSFVLACCLGLAAMVSAQRADPADVALKAAMQKELVDGNVTAAIDAYKQIVARYASNAPVVAAALVRLGNAYEILGDTQARAAYDRVVRQFPDQKEAAAEARARLAALTGPRPTSGGISVRLEAVGDDAASDASITSDGRFLIRPDWETGDLVVRDMATRDVKRLMAKRGSYDTSGEETENPVLSPDARYVVYSWWPDDTVAKVDRYQLRVMDNKAGAQPRVLIDGPVYDDFQAIAWSPLGDSILMTLRKPDLSWQIGWVAMADGKVTPLKTLDWRLRGDRPSLSPDGKYLAYSALTKDPGRGVRRFPSLPAGRSTEQHIYVLATDGSGSETELVKGPSINESPVWTSDGRHLLFVSDRSGSFGLWSIEMNDGKAVNSPSPVATTATGRISPVGITRAGTYYYVPEDVPGGAGVDVFIANINPDTGQVRGSATRLSDSGVDGNRSPAWSPDGTRIAFKRRLPSGSNVLVVHDLTTGVERIDPIYAGGEQNSAPIWFHSGYSLVVRASAFKGPALRHVDLNTGRFEILAHTVPPENWVKAVLSLDDRTLYVLTYDAPDASNRGLVRVLAWDLATGSRRDIWKVEGRLLNRPESLALSPDGRTLAAILQREGWQAQRLVLIGVDQGGYRELSTAVEGSMLAWIPDGRGLIVAAAGSATGVPLVRVSADTGRQSPTGLTINQPFGHVVDVSPDASRIVYSDSTRESQLWAIENLPSILKTAR